MGAAPGGRHAITDVIPPGVTPAEEVEA